MRSSNASKVLQAELAGRPEAGQRSVEEARVGGQLPHRVTPGDLRVRSE